MLREIIVDDSLKKLGVEGNSLVIENGNQDVEQEISFSRFDSITIFGNSQLSTQLIKKLAEEKKEVHYFSKYGRYIASIETPQYENF